LQKKVRQLEDQLQEAKWKHDTEKSDSEARKVKVGPTELHTYMILACRLATAEAKGLMMARCEHSNRHPGSERLGRS
jgi:hypothetical protein